MNSDSAPFARVSRDIVSWLIILALVLPWLASTATTSASFATDSTVGLASPVAQDNVATLSTAWKAARALEFRSGHDPDDAIAPIIPFKPPEGDGTDNTQRTTAILRIVPGTGLPPSRAPPLI